MTTLFYQQDPKLVDVLQMDRAHLSLSLLESRISKHSLKLLETTPKACKFDDNLREQLFSSSRYSFGDL